MPEGLTANEFRKAHHFFVSEGIDKNKMQQDALANAMDKRSPGDSVIHYHAYTEGKCPADCKPDVYKKNVGLVKNG